MRPSFARHAQGEIRSALPETFGCLRRGAGLLRHAVVLRAGIVEAKRLPEVLGRAACGSIPVAGVRASRKQAVQRSPRWRVKLHVPDPGAEQGRNTTADDVPGEVEVRPPRD